MKGFFKWFLIGIIAIGAAFGSYLAGYWLKAGFDLLKEKRIVENAQKEIFNLYNDEYGGKTPQDTYEMFIAALKAGDVDLAAKYFVFDKQEKKRVEFQAMKMKEELGEYIEKLPKWGELEERERLERSVREFMYKRWQPASTLELQGKKFDFPAGEYAGSIILDLNAKNVWKISVL